MEYSPFLDPRFLLAAGAMVIALVGWFIRLESKTVTNNQTIVRLEGEINSLWKEFETHRLNQDIHFNLRISQQVEQGNERRFQTIERQLTQINDKLDRMAENRLADKK